jgi:hypothetical protein
MKAPVTTFKKELSALLKKYNAEIFFSCDSCSDLHGVTGQNIRAMVAGKNTSLSWDWSLTGGDLK